MSSTFQSIPGTFDILPDNSNQGGSTVFGSSAWQEVERVIHRIMRSYNFEEIRTPVLEPTALIARGVGEETDIVSKEMFAFERSGTNYVMRPEITAPVMRSFLEHHLEQRGGVQKLYYIGPCFRAERPQKGRFRQFHQFGSEIVGTSDARADAECILVMLAIYEAFGINHTTLRLNTLGDEDSRPRYRDALVEYLKPYADELSETSRKRLDRNPLRILDTKVEHERNILADAPTLLDYVDEKSLEHYEQVKGWLDDQDIEYEEDPYLVRGLDYYTRTAFELESPQLGAQSALAGGGRYDGLAEALGSSNRLPATGFAAGFERLFLALEANNADLPATPEPDVFFAAIGEEAEAWVFHIVERLRREGIHAASDLKGRSLKSQMKEANRQNAAYALIVGGNELADEKAQVKHMKSGEQVEIAFSDLVSFFRERSGSTADQVMIGE